MPDNAYQDRQSSCPKLDTLVELPEGRVRSGQNRIPVPHSKLGQIALWVAASFTVVMAIVLGWCKWEMDYHGLGSALDWIERYNRLFAVVFLASFFGLGLAFIFGAISLLSVGTRKTTGLLAMALVCGTAVLFGIFIVNYVDIPVLSMK